MAIASHPEGVPDKRVHAIGSLVNARGRDWVVLPSASPEVLRLRPLTGTEEEVSGLFLPLEGASVRSASFAPPDPALAGDAAGGLLLRDAARLAIRNGAAPFRSLGRIAVTPRPYQFVPLIMALRLDPVRLLIADDVGVGKTIEAGMIARELLDRGDVRRLAVLCPPHLCQQWQDELRDKFAIEAAIVQPATIGRLERALPRRDLSLYQYYSNLVVSIDFVKSERNRDHFLQNAPDLIIVDEAHIAARPPGHGASANQHQRYELVRDLAADPARNLILVTATPHSGFEESFRSLLGLIDPSFDVARTGTEARATSVVAGAGALERRKLAPHLVQRRRADLEHWLGEVTPFPTRLAEERAYALSAPYHKLFEAVLAYCRESIASSAGLRGHQQRVRHWAAIALLRCLLSSPAAAEAVLMGRAQRQGMAEEVALDDGVDIDAIYRPQVLDPVEEGGSGDYIPSAPLEAAEPELNDSEKRKLAGFLRDARGLRGPERDTKLADAAGCVASLLRDGFRPIVFCRFIATARYLAEWLPKLLGAQFPHLRVDAVTGEIGDEERREKVDSLVGHPVRVLVATDCLSEGINLQEWFDAVVHYDLPWNPNRLEQREGRVDRFGQRKPEVRTALLYGADNPVDQVVLEVLIRKAREIRRQLGISVPVPVESDAVIQAVVDSVLLRRGGPARQLGLALDDPTVSRLHNEWQQAAEGVSKNRAYFAQHGIQPDEVAAELRATDPVLGDAGTVRRFMVNAAQRLGGELRSTRRPEVWELSPGVEMTRTLRAAGAIDGLDGNPQLAVAFDPMAAGEARPLGRTDPIVETYCETVLGRALAPNGDENFARCGAIVTDAVSRRTAIALLRLRYLLRERREGFAEEVILAGFRREGECIIWLDGEETRTLLEAAQPRANISPEERTEQVGWALRTLDEAGNPFQPIVDRRVAALHDANARLRSLLKAHPLEIVPHMPPDILGLYVLLPGADPPAPPPRPILCRPAPPWPASGLGGEG